MNVTSVDAAAQDVGGSITFGGNADVSRTFATIGGFHESATAGNYNGYLVFGTRVNGANVLERMRITSAGLVGLGTSAPLSELHVTRALTQGATGKALAIFDQIENQDILTASSGGITKFVIKNDGTASSSAGFTVNGAGNIQSTNNQTLTIGGSSTGFINIDSNSGQINLLDNTTINGTLTGLTGLTLASGSITLGGTTGTSTQCITGGATTAWTACATGFPSPFRELLGSVVQLNTTEDFLAGGQASTSATFKVTGQGNPFAGTQVGASVSANTSFAGFIADNRGSGDLFTASSAGMTRFTIRANGNVGIGTNLPGDKLEILS